MNIKTKCLALFVKLKQMLNNGIKPIDTALIHTCIKPNVSSSCGSVIAWKNQLFDVVTMKNVTHSITAIYIDSFSSMVKVVIEKGLTVYTVKFTMEHAHQIGFINVKALSNYC